MTAEFFSDPENDPELETIRKAMGFVIGDLQTMQARAFNFSKQRLRTRLEGIQHDLAIIVKSLPSPETGDTQSQEQSGGSRT